MPLGFILVIPMKWESGVLRLWYLAPQPYHIIQDAGFRGCASHSPGMTLWGKWRAIVILEPDRESSVFETDTL